MGGNRINPKQLPWFPLYTAQWIGSPDVLAMTLPERGMYISILAACWQYGSLPTDPWKLSRLLQIRYETTTRWLQKWSTLVACAEHLCSDHVVAVYQPCSNFVVPKLREHAQTLTNYDTPPVQTRRDKTRNESRRQQTTVSPQVVVVTQPSSSVSTQQETPTEPVPTETENNPTPEPVPSPVQDIRDWNEDRFGVSGERLNRCITYQLDHAKNPWYRETGITAASMDRPKFIAKLNGDTPAGWSPNKPVTQRVETDAQREQREYRERVANLMQKKKENLRKEGKPV